LSDKRAATSYGWISPYNKARYAQAPSRSGRHKRKSAKFWEPASPRISGQEPPRCVRMQP